MSEHDQDTANIGVELMSVADVMRELQVGRTTVYNLIHAGELKSVKVGRYRRIVRQSFNDYLERCFQEANSTA